jgi:hypothetical protein
MVSDRRRVCDRKGRREDKSGRAERDSRNSTSARGHHDLPFILGRRSAPPPFMSRDKSTSLVHKVQAGHKCVRSQIAIVFGGEESSRDSRKLSLTSVVFDPETPNTDHILPEPHRCCASPKNSNQPRAQSSENAGVSVGWDVRPRQVLRRGGRKVNKPTCRKIRRRPILDHAVVRATMRWWSGGAARSSHVFGAQEGTGGEGAPETRDMLRARPHAWRPVRSFGPGPQPFRESRLGQDRARGGRFQRLLLVVQT